MLVILLIAAGLTIFGGSKSLPYSLELTPDASVVLVDGAGGEHAPGAFPASASLKRVVVRSGEATTVVANATNPGRWRIVDRAEGRGLIGQTKANKFLEPTNLVINATSASYIAIMAVGMTAVIILAGIDLSVGSIYGLAAIVGALVLSSIESRAGEGGASLFVALPVGILVTCGVGALCGLANGSMIVGLRVHPFVITLGMMAALRGLTFVIPKAIRGEQSIAGLPDAFQEGFFKLDVGGVYPVPLMVMVVVAVVGAFVLTKTVLGRQIFAVGGNPTAARYAGVPNGRVNIIVYTVMGALAGLSAAIYLGYYGSAETNAGATYELKVIAAAVIGGASLAGGRGTAVGAVLGAIVIQLIDNAMVILEINTDWTQIVMGAAIIIAVVIDQAKQRFAAGGQRG